MSEKMSRRKLLRRGSEAMVAGGVGAYAAAVGGVSTTAAVASASTTSTCTSSTGLPANRASTSTAGAA